MTVLYLFQVPIQDPILYLVVMSPWSIRIPKKVFSDDVSVALYMWGARLPQFQSFSELLNLVMPHL